ncbi:MAG: alkaline phosphatase D family protein [Nitrospira sp.]
MARLLTLLLITVATALTGAAEDKTQRSPRMASGDTTSERAVIWGQIDARAEMEVEYSLDSHFTDSTRVQGPVVDESSDFSGQVELQNLAPATRYFYRILFRERAGEPVDGPLTSATGTFRTAPLSTIPTPVSFVFSGDLGGQGFCRHSTDGYRIFSAMLERLPDFFVENGDFIYADGTCPAQGPAGRSNVPGTFAGISDGGVDWMDRTAVRTLYRDHWRYQLEDGHLSEFLRHVPLYAQWDDHEVINDAGWGWGYWNSDTQTRAGFENLVEAGREAFFQHLPIRRNSADPHQIYRLYQWGKDLDLILLDGRSYRSRNDAPDGLGKTLLGSRQLAWLKDTLAHSQATWKIVSADVPLSVPTGSKFGRDAWANGDSIEPGARTGFEYELLDLMRFLDDHQVKNVVFLAADVHFAAQLRYSIDPNGDGNPLIIHELIAGPLAAMRRQAPSPGFDSTLRPAVLYTEGGLFNFGYVRIARQADGHPHLIAEVYDDRGERRPGATLDLTPQ